MEKNFDEMTDLEKLRYDNFAAGKLSDAAFDFMNPGVMAWVSENLYFESELQKGIARGELWCYSNSHVYVPQSGTFDDMVKEGTRLGTNCSMPQAWAFIDMDVIHNGRHIWGDRDGSLSKWDLYGKYIGAVCDVMSWKGKYKFGQLYEAGMVKPGDIFYVKGHTFIYLADGIFMAAGHDGHWHVDERTVTDDPRHACFETWLYEVKPCSNYKCDIFWQLRFKDEYMPRFYRNAKGELVKNPAYRDELNIEYKEGISPEVPTIIEMVK